MAQDGTTVIAAKVIDARGLNCPLPVLRLRKYLLAAPPGAAVELLATDRAALRDVPSFCAANGHAVETLASQGTDLRFRVIRSSA